MDHLIFNLKHFWFEGRILHMLCLLGPSWSVDEGIFWNSIVILHFCLSYGPQSTFWILKMGVQNSPLQKVGRSSFVAIPKGSFQKVNAKNNGIFHMLVMHIFTLHGHSKCWPSPGLLLNVPLAFPTSEPRMVLDIRNISIKIKPTYNPIAMSVNVDEILLLDLWEDDITVTRHFIIFNVDHNLVVSRNLTDILFVIELGC